MPVDDKMKILVTGSHGQLGNEMARVAKGSSDEFIFTDIDELDITDSAAVQALVGREHVDVIVNCAAYTNVDRAEDDYATADRINNLATGNLAAAAKAADAILIHVSTDYVFDGTGCVPYTEDRPTAPTGVYGITKLAGEKAALATGCKCIILRTAWLYSVWGKNFVRTMIRLTAEKDSLGVVFDQVGSPTYAGDLADAIGHIIATRQLDKTGIYHFSNEGVCSWYDFTVAIAELAGNECDIRPIHSDEFPSKVKRPHYSVLDKTLFRNTFGYNIPHWMQSLKQCISRLKTI